MAESGVGRIQIRAKSAPGAEIDELLRGLEDLTGVPGLEIWIDDRVDLAALHPITGAHLGQKDLCPGDARSILGPGRRIGQSTHDLEQVSAADGDPAVDLVAFGPIFSTSSKQDPDPTVGLERLRRAREATRKPLVAIGGIDAASLQSVLETGVDAAAMIGAVSTPSVGASCRRLVGLAREMG